MVRRYERARRSVIEQVKDATDFPALVEETTGPLRHRPSGRPVMVHCPWHADHMTPSLAIYDDHAHCFGCGWHGDCFDWVGQRDGVDFRTALQELAHRAGVPLLSLTPEKEQEIRKQRDYEAALGVAARHFVEQLKATPAALAYARGRWPGDDFADGRIGYANGEGPLPDLDNERAQRVVEALNRRAASGGGAIVYIHDERGRTVYFSARGAATIRKEKESDQILLCHTDGSVLRFPFGPGERYPDEEAAREAAHEAEKWHYNPPAASHTGEPLAGPRRPYFNAHYSPRAPELVIVEGQACARTLNNWDVPAVALAGPGLTGDLAARLQRHVEQGATVYAVPDGDGKTRLEKLAEVVGPLLRVVTLPDDVIDVNAYAQDGATAENFRKLLDEAQTWLDLRIEHAAQSQGTTRDRAIEDLFPLLAQLPPVPLARYKGRLTRALEEIGARDFDRLLKAAQHVEDAPPPPEILEGDYPLLSPALDFLDDLAVVTVPFRVLVDGEPAAWPFLITSDRQMVAISGKRLVEIGERRVILQDPPAALGGTPRWKYADVQTYLQGEVPDLIETCLEVERLLDKYLDFRDTGTSDVLALWVMGTYLYPIFEAYPYVALQGPKNSGKTKTLDVVAKLAFNARIASSISQASLFRIVQATRGMLGIDEAERLSDPKNPLATDLRLILNAGYKKGSPAIRCVGDDHQVMEFEVYGPKMIASIRELGDVLASRCIRLTMLRTHGPKGNLTVSESGEDWTGARHQLYCFALQHFPGVRDAYLRGAGATGLNNRQAELWRPLLAIASYLDDQCDFEQGEGPLALLQDYARNKAAQAEQDGLDDWRTALLLALHELAVRGGKPKVRPKEVREAMGDFMDADDHANVNSQWVGYRLREFGFQKDGHGSKGSIYLTDTKMVEDIVQRYDIKEPKSNSNSDRDDGNGQIPF